MHRSQREKVIYNEVLPLISFAIELLNHFFKKKKKTRSVALKGKNGINLSESSIFEQSLILFKSL